MEYGHLDFFGERMYRTLIMILVENLIRTTIICTVKISVKLCYLNIHAIINTVFINQTIYRDIVFIILEHRPFQHTNFFQHVHGTICEK